MKNWILPDRETLMAYTDCLQGRYDWMVTEQGVLVSANVNPNKMARWLEVAREVQ